MSLHPQAAYPIPEDTQRVARAAFPRGNIYMRVADRLGTIYHDAEFAGLFPTRGQPAEAPARLALATVLQFAEGLSDRQAADAIRGRIDGKYVLGLDLTDLGFHHTALSEFRTRLVAGEAASLLLEALLTLAREQGLLKTRGRQRTDSTHVLASIRVRNRLERVGETLRAALNTLAVVAPDGLQALAPVAWSDRYSRRVENSHLPKTDEARKALAAVIGADGQTLLHAIDAAVDQPWLQEVPAVKTLRRIWAEQYREVNGQLGWREVKDMPSPAVLIPSPYDPEARYSTKREVEWVGYKVHVTETCDADTPHLIVNVETTPATTPADHMVKCVHTSLEQRGLLPAEPLVDKGYTDSQVLVESQRTSGVTLIGPIADDPSWQARAGTGFDKSQLLVDWDRKVVTCPMGKQSISWLPNTYKNGMTWEVRFARKDCTPCPRRAQCTRAKQEPRLLGLQEREPYEALQAARQRQTTEAFQRQYAPRAGIESAHAQGIRRRGLRQSRDSGLAKTHVQHLATAAALNFVRLGEWLAGTPWAKTRCSPFAALKAA
jgi:transposase